MAVKPAIVRYYVDEDLLGLGKIVAPLRPDLTFCGEDGAVVHGRRRDPCPIRRQATDAEWIAETARRGWLGITRDSNIQAHPSLMTAIREHGARVAALSSGEAGSKWAQLEVLMSSWRRLEAYVDTPGPLLLAVTRTQVRRLDLGRGPNSGR